MTSWLCRLPLGGTNDFQQLSEQASQCGVAAWCIRVGVKTNGELHPEQSLAALLQLPDAAPNLCLELQLQEPLSPADEGRLAEGLLPWLAHKRMQPLQGRPLLLLGEQHGFSHLQFGRQRLELSLRRLLHARGVPAPWLLDLQALPPRDADPHAYFRYLRDAHHGPWPKTPFVPLVLPPPAVGLERSQEHYAAWLAQAGAVSRLLHGGAIDAPVLIDDWLGHQRSWMPIPEPRSAEPASAEPCDAVREIGWGEFQPEHLAVLVHGYYLERLETLLARLPVGGGVQGLPPIDLYVSTPLEQLTAVEQLIAKQHWPRVRLFGVPNRGRDIAPFVLQLLPAALAAGHRFFVKVHTKASPHLGSSRDWGEGLLDALLDPERLRLGLLQLQREPGTGLLAPGGTLLPLSLALDQNREALLALQRQHRLEGPWILRQRFIAGSMMLGRLGALKPLLELDLQLDDFEREAGQTDGTLAHGCERWLSLLPVLEGWRLTEMAGAPVEMPAFGYGWVP